MAFAADGVIRETATGEGVADFTEMTPFYATSSGKIELFVKEGDTVAAGDPLFTLSADEEELDKSLQTAQDAAFTKQSIADMEKGKNDADDAALNQLAAYRFDIENLKRDIALKEEELAKTRILFKNGTVPQNDVLTIENDLEKLQDSLLQTEEKLKTAEDAYNRSRTEAEEQQAETYRNEVERLNKDLADFEFQRREAEIDKTTIEHTIADLNRQKANGGIVTVSAETAGKITAITDIEDSAYINKNSLILKIGRIDAPFFAVLRFPEDAYYVVKGISLTLSVKSRALYNIEGTVTQVSVSEGSLNAHVEFSAAGLSGGETVSAKAENVSELYSRVLPNTAIRVDPATNQYYYLYAEKQNSWSGYAYYARMQGLEIEQQDDKNTAFRAYYDNDGTENPPVIINTDAAVNEGDQIRVVGGSDLIEIR